MTIENATASDSRDPGPPTDTALDCFVHGLSHLISELGLAKGLSFARQAILRAETLPDEVVNV